MPVWSELEVLSDSDAVARAAAALVAERARAAAVSGRPFRFAVHFAHKILGPLRRDREQVEVARAAIDDVAGAACRLDGDGKHRMHGHVGSLVAPPMTADRTSGTTVFIVTAARPRPRHGPAALP